MPMLALADALRDFGPPPKAPQARAPAPIEVPPPSPPTIDIDSIVAAEVEKVESSVTQRLSAVYENTLQAERENHAAALKEARAELGKRAADQIATRLGQVEAKLLELASGAVARMLAGMASDDLQRRSIDALASAIKSALEDTDAVRVRVSGPQSLFEALSAAVGPRAAGFDYREASGLDLSVDVDGNLFETRLAEWASVVGEVVA